MKVRSLIFCSAIGISAIVLTAQPAVADELVFGSSGATPVTLSITTTTGDNFTLTGISTGWYDNTGQHLSGDSNYLAGNFILLNQSLSYNDYFTFNLSGVQGTIASASLTAFDNQEQNEPFYTLYDVSTPASVLEANQNGAVGIYNDLGSGTVYGTHQVVAADNAANVTITLDSDALAAIQSAEGTAFSIGGSTSPSSVPEPSSLALLGAGLLGALRITRRHRA